MQPHKLIAQLKDWGLTQLASTGSNPRLGIACNGSLTVHHYTLQYSVGWSSRRACGGDSVMVDRPVKSNGPRGISMPIGASHPQYYPQYATRAPTCSMPTKKLYISIVVIQWSNTHICARWWGLMWSPCPGMHPGGLTHRQRQQS